MSELATSISTLTNEPGRLPSQTVQNPKANISMVKMSDMQEALEEAARPSLSTTKVDKKELIGMMWEDESYAQSYRELMARERLKEAQTVALSAEQQRGPATYKHTVKHFTRRNRPDWNQEEDRPNDGRTWVKHADNGRYAFTVNMTPPPITHINVPVSGWDDNKDLDSDAPRWDSLPNIYASEQSIYLEDQELNEPDPANPESEEDAESTDYKGLRTEKIGTQDSSYSMKIIASEDHATQKNKIEKGLEPRNGQNGLITEKLITSSHEAQLEMSKDPGAFTVTCGIGKAQIHHCLIDLGVAVNVLPYPLYYSLGLGPLKPPKLLIELGDKSCVHLVGVLEKLMLRVGKLIVPADFYVIPIGDTSKDDPPTLILGRPFLFTTRAKIDMSKGSLSLAFGGIISDFYIYDDGRTDTKKPPDIVNTSDLNALVSDQPREAKSVTRPAAMVKRSSPTWENRKANPPGQWSPVPSTSSHKNLGRVKARINAGAAEKFDLSRPWDPDPS
ncbi:unnamed protein product [Rhodiola kirilowii]